MPLRSCGWPGLGCRLFTSRAGTPFVGMDRWYHRRKDTCLVSTLLFARGVTLHMSKPMTDVDVGPESRLNAFQSQVDNDQAADGTTENAGAIVWPADIHVKAVHVVIGYLLRSGWNQPDAITQSKAIVDAAAQRSRAGTSKETAMPIERLALLIAMEHVGQSISAGVTVVPTERREPMRPAAVNRLAGPLRVSEWSSRLAAKCAAAPSTALGAVSRWVPLLRLRERRSGM